MSMPYYWLVSCLSPQYYGKRTLLKTNMTFSFSLIDWQCQLSGHVGSRQQHSQRTSWTGWLPLWPRDTVMTIRWSTLLQAWWQDETQWQLMKLVNFSGGFSTVWDGRKPSSPGQGHRPSTLCDLSSLFGFHLMDGRKCTAIPKICYFHANPLEVSKFWFSWL